MTGGPDKPQPWFAGALIIFQITIQIMAWKFLWLGDLDLRLPLRPQTLQSSVVAVVMVVSAVAGSAWLGIQSRRRNEAHAPLLFAPFVLPLGWMLVVGLGTHAMFLSDYQGYPASAFVLKYADKAIAGLVWCSAAAAVSLRLWAVIALAFNGHIAVRYAEALSLADPSEAMYGWDAKPEAIASVLNQIGLVSLGLAAVAALALLWKYARRPGTY